MVIKEEQVYLEFFDNKTISFECFYSDKLKYCDKKTFELIIKFLQDNQNNLTEGIMKDMFNNIRSEINNIINLLFEYINKFTNFYNHYDDNVKQFCINNEIVNTVRFSIINLNMLKLDEYKIIRYKCHEQQNINKNIEELESRIEELETKIEELEYGIEKLESNNQEILEKKYIELKRKILQQESTIEMFKGYYEHKYKSLYDYNKLKEDKKLLHKEFYVVAKLMKLNR